MHRVAVFVVMTLAFFTLSAQAQESPRGEVFGGLSLHNSDAADSTFGWQASGAVNMGQHLGVVADFGGQYGDVVGVDMTNHQFLFGPRVRTSRSTFQGFAHSLFGIQRTSLSGFGSSSNFAMGIGGGLDILSSSGFGVRAIQFDWLPTKVGDTWFQDQFRLGFGVVLPIGN